MVTNLVDFGRGDQSSDTANEVFWPHQEMGLSIVLRFCELEGDASVLGESHLLLGERRSHEIAAQTFSAAGVALPNAYTGVYAKASVFTSALCGRSRSPAKAQVVLDEPDVGRSRAHEGRG